MQRWVEDAQPLSDVLEHWVNAFSDKQQAYDAFRRSPVEEKAPLAVVDGARRSLMHFWNQICEEVKLQQSKNTDFTMPGNLHQRGQTWRGSFEMLDIANYYRRKLWTQHPEGKAHYLESGNRPSAYAMLEQSAEPGPWQFDPKDFAKKEQAAVEDAKVALSQLLDRAKEGQAASGGQSPQDSERQALQQAGQDAVKAVEACNLPVTLWRLRQEHGSSPVSTAQDQAQQDACQSDLPAAVERVIKQFWQQRCENPPA